MSANHTQVTSCSERPLKRVSRTASNGQGRSEHGVLSATGDPWRWALAAAIDDISRLPGMTHFKFDPDPQVRELELHELARLTSYSRKHPQTKKQKPLTMSSAGRVLVRRNKWFSPSALIRRQRGLPGFVVRNHSTDKKRSTKAYMESWLVEVIAKRALVKATQLVSLVQQIWAERYVSAEAPSLCSPLCLSSEAPVPPISIVAGITGAPLDVVSAVVPSITDPQDRTTASLRTTNWVMRMTKADRNVVFGGDIDNDCVKGHVGCHKTQLGDAGPHLRHLYDNPSEYVRHADEAGVPLSLVKLYVTQRCIGSPCTASPMQSFVKTAFDEGLDYDTAKKALMALNHGLSGVSAEIDANLMQTFGRSSGDGLTSEAAVFYMRWESQFIYECEIRCRALGILTWNLHDGFISDREVPEWVFQEAKLAVGLVGMHVKSKRMAA